MELKLILLSGSLVMFSSVALYLLLRKNNDEEEQRRSVTARQSVIEVRIPRAAVGHVIGRDGANIRQIQQDTNTKIRFKETAGVEDRVCVIRGKAEFAQEAERLIHRSIADRPIVTTITISVPQQACGRIIGRGGENIREMCTVSHAKILVDRSNKPSPDGMRTVTITGTEDQIQMAKQLVRDKVEAEHAMRRRIDLSTASRTQRLKQPTQVGCCSEGSGPNWEAEAAQRTRETLISTSSDGYIEVFVSAVDTPSRFWLQVKSPRSVQLDRLVDEMTDFYSSCDNHQEHKLAHVEVGQLVAAPFPHDGSWYRAEVLHVTSPPQATTAAAAADSGESRDSCVTVFYVDFGDTALVSGSRLARLRSEHLSLSDQALECRLHAVKPAGDVWSEEAVACFERLTHAAQWRTLMARVQDHQTVAAARHVPLVSLVDTNSATDVNIGKELVKRGHALWQHEDSGLEASSTASVRERSPIPPVQQTVSETPKHSVQDTLQRSAA